jgi:hypothetical protein
MISKCDILYIFIRIYSKSLAVDFGNRSCSDVQSQENQINIPNQNLITKIKILNELGNLIFTHFITFINHTSNINLLYNSCEYMNGLYTEYINQCTSGKYSEFMKKENIEILARDFCFTTFSNKYNLKVSEFKYDYKFLSLLLSLKTKIELYIFRRLKETGSTIDIRLFYLYCKSLANTYCKMYSKELYTINHVHLDNQVGLVEDLLTFYEN